jgi:hypothetical protein
VYIIIGRGNKKEISMIKRLLIVGLTCLAFNLYSSEANTTARVIFSEAGPSCSANERWLVASVIKNRIGHIGFSKKNSMLQVVLVRNAFECINDKNNSNWAMSNPKNIGKHLKNKRINRAWKHSKLLASGKFDAYKNVHFFMTKGVKVPSNYINRKYWKITKVKTTKHFDFYSLSPRK